MVEKLNAWFLKKKKCYGVKVWTLAFLVASLSPLAKSWKMSKSSPLSSFFKSSYKCQDILLPLETRTLPIEIMGMGRNFHKYTF